MRSMERSSKVLPLPCHSEHSEESVSWRWRVIAQCKGAATDLVAAPISHIIGNYYEEDVLR
jgi:hypothetical protein